MTLPVTAARAAIQAREAGCGVSIAAAAWNFPALLWVLSKSWQNYGVAMLVDFWAGVGPVWQIIGMLALVALVVLLVLWPSGAVAVALAAVVVVASVIVTWDQVATYRTQKATGNAAPGPQAAGIAVPPPQPTRAGS